MNTMTTDAIDFYNTHRWAVSDNSTNRYLGYFATEGLALADVDGRFGWDFRVVLMDDTECQAAVRSELGLLVWGPVQFIDGIEVASDLMRDWHRGLQPWDKVTTEHRDRQARNMSA